MAAAKKKSKSKAKRKPTPTASSSTTLDMSHERARFVSCSLVNTAERINEVINEDPPKTYEELAAAHARLCNYWGFANGQLTEIFQAMPAGARPNGNETSKP